MADVVLSVDIDVQNAVAGMANLQSLFNSSNSAVKNLESTLSGLGASTVNIDRVIANTAGNITNLNLGFKTLNDQGRVVSGTITKVVGDLGVLAQAEADASAKVTAGNQALADATKRQKDYADAVRAAAVVRQRLSATETSQRRNFENTRFDYAPGAALSADGTFVSTNNRIQEYTRQVRTAKALLNDIANLQKKIDSGNFEGAALRGLETRKANKTAALEVQFNSGNTSFRADFESATALIAAGRVDSTKVRERLLQYAEGRSKAIASVLSDLQAKEQAALANVAAALAAKAAAPSIKAANAELDKFKKEVAEIQAQIKKVQSPEFDLNSTKVGPQQKSLFSIPTAAIDAVTPVNAKFGDASALTNYVQKYRISAQQISDINAKLASGFKITGFSDPVERGLALAITKLRDAVPKIQTEAEKLAAAYSAPFQRVGTIAFTQLIGQSLAAIRGELSTATQAAIQFQEAISQIRTISQGDVGAGFDQLARGAEILSKKYGTDLLDTTKGIYNVVSDQIAKGQDAITFAEEGIKFAKATVTAPSDALRGLGAAINSYNLSAGDAERVSATLFKTIELGRSVGKDFAQDFGRAAKTAADVGVSFEELAAIVATGTIQGRNTNTVLTSTRNLLISILKPSDEFKNFIREIGFESGQSAIRTLGFAGFLEKIQELADKKGTQGLVEIANNIRSLDGIISLTGSGFETYNANLKKLRQEAANPVTYRGAQEIIGESAGVRVQKQLNSLQITIEQELGTRLVAILDEVIKKFGNLSDIAKAVIETIAHIVKPTIEVFVIFGQVLKGIVDLFNYLDSFVKGIFGATLEATISKVAVILSIGVASKSVIIAVQGLIFVFGQLKLAEAALFAGQPYLLALAVSIAGLAANYEFFFGTAKQVAEITELNIKLEKENQQILNKRAKDLANLAEAEKQVNNERLRNIGFFASEIRKLGQQATASTGSIYKDYIKQERDSQKEAQNAVRLILDERVRDYESYLGRIKDQAEKSAQEVKKSIEIIGTVQEKIAAKIFEREQTARTPELQIVFDFKKFQELKDKAVTTFREGLASGVTSNYELARTQFNFAEKSLEDAQKKAQDVQAIVVLNKLLAEETRLAQLRVDLEKELQKIEQERAAAAKQKATAEQVNLERLKQLVKQASEFRVVDARGKSLFKSAEEAKKEFNEIIDEIELVASSRSESIQVKLLGDVVNLRDKFESKLGEPKITLHASLDAKGPIKDFTDQLSGLYNNQGLADYFNEIEQKTKNISDLIQKQNKEDIDILQRKLEAEAAIASIKKQSELTAGEYFLASQSAGEGGEGINALESTRDAKLLKYASRLDTAKRTLAAAERDREAFEKDRQNLNRIKKSYEDLTDGYKKYRDEIAKGEQDNRSQFQRTADELEKLVKDRTATEQKFRDEAIRAQEAIHNKELARLRTQLQILEAKRAELKIEQEKARKPIEDALKANEDALKAARGRKSPLPEYTGAQEEIIKDKAAQSKVDEESAIRQIESFRIARDLAQQNLEAARRNGGTPEQLKDFENARKRAGKDLVDSIDRARQATTDRKYYETELNKVLEQRAAYNKAEVDRLNEILRLEKERLELEKQRQALKDKERKENEKEDGKRDKVKQEEREAEGKKAEAGKVNAVNKDESGGFDGIFKKFYSYFVPASFDTTSVQANRPESILASSSNVSNFGDINVTIDAGGQVDRGTARLIAEEVQRELRRGVATI